MNAELNLDKILSQVSKLKKTEQVTLLKKIASMLQGEEKPGKPVKLSEISGMGSSLWHNVNIDKYIDGERQW
jgi:hypothetical protein